MKFSRSISLILSLMFTACSVVHAQSTLQFDNSTTRPYLDDVEQMLGAPSPVSVTYNSGGTSVTHSWNGRADEQLVADSLGNWVNGNVLGQWGMGNPQADQLILGEVPRLKDPQTLNCNSQDSTTHLHSYADLLTPPTLYVDPADPKSYGSGAFGFSPVCDETRAWRYEPNGLGVPAGECLSVLPVANGSSVDLHCIWSDLVDYLIPTAKINISNQLFYSRYLDQGLVVNALDSLQNDLEIFAGIKSVETLSTVMQSMGVAPGVPNAAAITPDLFDNPGYAWLRSKNSGRGWVTGEPQVAADYQPFFHPHELKAMPTFSTDLAANWVHYWLTESNAVDGAEYSTFLGDHNVPCVANNMQSGKTPDYASAVFGIPPATTFGGQLFGRIRNIPCLYNVGEVRPYSRYRRPHTSDGFYQTFVKTLKHYYRRFPGQTYTFYQERDRLHFLPDPLGGQMNAKFIQASGAVPDPESNCNLFSRNVGGQPMRNIDYRVTNDRVVGSREETTVEIFTAFSGCWAPDPPVGYYQNIFRYRWLDSVHGPSNPWTLNADLRLE